MCRRWAVAIPVVGLLIVLCYFFVDRPVARFVHDHPPFPEALVEWSALLSDWPYIAAGLVVTGAVAWRFCQRAGRLQTVLMALAASLATSVVLKQLLKWVFGRTWPKTQVGGAPSWIGSSAYGFHPFHFGSGYASFPSGHAALVCSVLSVLWHTHPRWRWLWAVLGLVLCVALVGMNFHFVGDVLAGALLGCITGSAMTALFRLDRT
ncbi:MAG: phosphatase PAP2 family protein [Thermoguttaceae bacterium]|jgi:membrane-associated phospholipid phosphatase